MFGLLGFGSSSQLERDNSSRVNEEDLKHIFRLVEEKDGGPAWIQMMDRSTPTMSYQAWRRDPEVVLETSLSLRLILVTENWAKAVIAFWNNLWECRGESAT